MDMSSRAQELEPVASEWYLSLSFNLSEVLKDNKPLNSHAVCVTVGAGEVGLVTNANGGVLLESHDRQQCWDLGG